MAAWSGLRWVAYATFPQAEALAARELAQAGYVAYAPLVVERRQDAVIPSLFRRVLAARFPGYGFVQLAAGDPWLPVHRDMGGIRGLLLNAAGRPEPVAAGQVEACQADDERLCCLQREVLPCWPEGASVVIEAGAFRGRVGVTLACDGLATTVELVVFGRLVPVRLDRGSVAAMQAAAA